jgi:two-component system phosphate regulon sensor histidine kinase PhoR
MHFSADSAKIEQVLENLIGNAIKYVQEGGAINVSWEMANDSIALKVSDNGPGIEAEHLPRLFERFYRVDKGRARDAGGTGLGLAIVKHIVQSHGGEVEVASTMGKGSEFICYFPKTADH